MAVVDPNKTGGFRACETGKKVLAVVGIDKRKNKKDNQQYEVHYVCVKDLSAPNGQDGDKGADHWDRFILMDSVLFRLGQVMKAAGHTTPFDTDDSALISDVLSNCYIVGTISSRVYEGETQYETARNGWAPYSGAEEPDWADVIAKGVEGHEKLRAARKKALGGGSSAGAAKPAARAPADAPSDGNGDDEGPMY